MPLDNRLLKSIEDFAASVIREIIKVTDAQLQSSVKAAAGLEIPFVAKLKAWVTSQYKAATQSRETIRRTVERDITRLITDTNLLLDDAREKLNKTRPTGENGATDLLVIIDNLDRLPPPVAEKLVFDHGDFLRQLRANVIYTVPVSVLHSPKGIERVFPDHDILPMVKVYRYDRRKLRLDWSEEGVEGLVQAVSERADVDALFDGLPLVKDLARHSGGCLRHLMQSLRYACETAYGRKATKVNEHDVEDALRRLQFDFERMIPPQHYPVLCEVARHKNLPNHDLGREALFNLSVLEYNGQKRWNYVHPIVWRIERFEEGLHVAQAKDKAKA